MSTEAEVEEDKHEAAEERLVVSRGGLSWAELRKYSLEEEKKG